MGKIRKSYYLIFFLLSFIIGAGVFAPNISYFVFVAVVLLILAVWKKRYRKLAVVCIIGFTASVVRLYFDVHISDESSIDFYNNRNVSFEGVIIDEPDKRVSNVKYTVEADKVGNASCFGARVLCAGMEVQGKVLVTTNKYPEFKYGDRVNVLGELQTPMEFPDFSYKDYLGRYHIYSVMYYPKIELINEGEGNFFWNILFNMKHKFEDALNKIYLEPHASLASGILIGARRGMPDDLLEKFNKTGLTHIIAISGYNVTIIINAVLLLFSFASRRKTFLAVCVFVIFFTFIVGASASVVRAAIMGILGFLALQLGRQKNTEILILITAAFMVFWNPRILLHDIGFQLSFLALIGIIYLVPLFPRFFEYIPKNFSLRDGFTMAVAAQITAVPAIVFHFHRFSVISPIANILVVMVVPLAMFFSFLAAVVSFIYFPLALLVGYVGWGFLEIIILVAENFSQIPYASLDIYGVGKFLLVFYYLVLIVGYFYIKKTKKIR